jgi:hypothetical protein
MTQPLRLATALLALGACASPEPQGLRLSDQGTGPQVKFDIHHRPLPDIPLPNDFATRHDPTSPTGRRVNASMVAPTQWESVTRQALDQLDGWGTYAPISVGFTAPLDLAELARRHVGDDYAFDDDAVYLLDVTADSPELCQAVPLDLGEGNFPLVLERQEYYPNDPRAHTDQLLFEEVDEDANGNGVLDPGEDTDMDGVLDRPNLPHPGAGRFATMSHYERETHSLILRPVLPMRETATYAVVLTRRLLGEDGHPVRSPFAFVNHTGQTDALRPLEGCLSRYGLSLADVAFTWSFTTQSITRHLKVVREGMYGHGPMARLAEEYPANVYRLFDLKARGSAGNLKIVSGAEMREALTEALKLVSGSIGTEEQALIDSQKFVDFYVVGQYQSPQFFPREDADGKPLPLYRQSWDLDPRTGRAFIRPELVTFLLTVPKFRTGPAPVVLVGHGHMSNKLEAAFYTGTLARYGLATFAIDAVSHGLGIGELELEAARGMFRRFGLEPMFNALLQDRAFDQNGDGIKDSGADFWTAYTVHTRDVVRQSVVDLMQAVRILKAFDGVQRWTYDFNGDGQKDLAGDFDGDGQVDIGGQAPIHATGGSLGGILTSVLGGIEPQLEVAVPVASGGGLADIGIRRAVGDVSILLRIMGPLMLTRPDAQGQLQWWQDVPNLRDEGLVRLGPVGRPLAEGDTALVRNLRTGVYRCARVQAGGLLRVSVSSDEGDPLQVEVYEGVLPSQAPEGCQVPQGTSPYLTLDRLEVEAEFQGKGYAAGSPLVALGDGFGMRRGTPEFRRFMGIAQLLLDPVDPINYAPNYEHREVRFATGEQVRTRALVISTVGDTSVAVATGIAQARAAGFIGLTEKDPRYGKTANRVLIDVGAVEGVERTGRHLNPQGEPVLMDVEHLSALVPVDDGFDVPRLDPPLRLVGPSPRVGGITGTLLPMNRPTGDHGYRMPDPGRTYDIGTLMANLLGRYLSSNGTILSFDSCQHDSSCEWIRPVPSE